MPPVVIFVVNAFVVWATSVALLKMVEEPRVVVRVLPPVVINEVRGSVVIAVLTTTTAVPELELEAIVLPEERAELLLDPVAVGVVTVVAEPDWKAVAVALTVAVLEKEASASAKWVSS